MRGKTGLNCIRFWWMWVNTGSNKTRWWCDQQETIERNSNANSIPLLGREVEQIELAYCRAMWFGFVHLVAFPLHFQCLYLDWSEYFFILIKIPWPSREISCVDLDIRIHLFRSWIDEWSQRHSGLTTRTTSLSGNSRYLYTLSIVRCTHNPPCLFSYGRSAGYINISFSPFALLTKWQQQHIYLWSVWAMPNGNMPRRCVHRSGASSIFYGHKYAKLE